MLAFIHKRPYPTLALLLVILTAAALWPVAINGFVNYDDGDYITDNPHVRTGLTVANVIWAFSSGYVANWHPITWISHMVDVQLFGLSPGLHHLTSLLLHILNTVLLFVVLGRMTGSAWRAAFVAALFAVHPLHVESVAWASERKDILSTTFWLLTMLAYVRYVRVPSPARYALVLILYAIGLMSKPMLVSLPLMLLALDYWPLGRFGVTHRKEQWPGWRLLREKAPLMVLAAASCVVTYTVQQSWGAVNSLAHYGLGLRIGNALVSYVMYLLKTVWPAGLSVYYPHPGYTLEPWKPIAAGVALIVGSFFVWKSARNRPYLAVGLIWYFVTLVPVIGIVQVAGQAMADRYTYVPLIGVFIAAAWGLPELLVRKKAGLTARGRRKSSEETPNLHTPWLAIPAVAIILVLAALSYQQTGVWRDGETLFKRALEVNEANPLAHVNLGSIYEQKGDLANAERHYRRGVETAGEYALPHRNLARVLCKLGAIEEAIPHFQQALNIEPDDLDTHYNLAVALAKTRRYSEAAEQFREVLKKEPNRAVVHNDLGNALMQIGNLKEAEAEYRKALRLRPNYAGAHFNLGMVLAGMRRYEEGITEFKEAIRLKPNNGEFRFSLAVACYFKGDYAEAWRAYHASRKLGYQPNPGFVQALAKRMPDPHAE